MFKNPFQSREEKIREKAANFIAEGMGHLSGKFYNGAMIAFDKAMELNSDEVYPRLKNELSKAAESGELGAALAVGLNLIKQENQDYELANKLGNYARELKDYKQANGLYKTALKIKRNYHFAFYNLAASLAKVDIFDEAVINALSQFDSIADYVLPDFMGDNDIVENYTVVVQAAKQGEFQEKHQELLLQRVQKTEAGQMLEAKGIDLKIEKLKKTTKEVSVGDIMKEFQKKIREDRTNAKSHRYNLGLYALSKKRPEIALKAIKGITVDDFETIDLLKVIALEQKGQLDKAIDMLIQLLGKNKYNRYYNVNLGLMYQKVGKELLSIKYLIKTAYLLKKSGGLYNMRELLKQADTSYEEGNLKKAINYYKIAVTEIQDPEIWNKIGTIYIKGKKYDKAVMAFRQMQKLDPDSQAANDQLQAVHDYYREKGEQLFEGRKFKPAVDNYLKALEIFRLPETMKKAAAGYKQLNNPEKETKMLDEWQKLIDEEKAKEQEEMRQQLITNGKQLLKHRKFPKAIQSFETAFRMKVDRDIFMQLVKLYQGLKKKNELKSLEGRWEKMLQFDEEMKKQDKRKNQGSSQSMQLARV